jgi:hypothetical protein
MIAKTLISAQLE